MSYTWHHPFSAIVSGPSQSGKSKFVKRLIKNRFTLINPIPKKIYWCYTENQSSYNKLRNDSDISFINGIPENVEDLTDCLIIFDDLMQELKNNPQLVSLTTRGCHHHRNSCINITQNLFFGDRTSRINSQYIVLLKNPSDKLQIINLGRQLYPDNTKYFREAYEDATSKSHGYLLIDLHQNTPGDLRLKTNIFPNETSIVYVPINKTRNRKIFNIV